MVTKDTIGAGPRLVGRYQLISPAVSGALGELWLARIASGPEEGRVVDVRLIPRLRGLEKRDVERLTNAGFAAMELRHPRVAAVLDVVVGTAEIAIVSEHVTSFVLQAVMRPEASKRVSVPAGVACRVAIDLLEALDAVKEPWAEIFLSDAPEEQLLHQSVHGGLLPDGLVIASFGEAMLLEVGLAGIALTVPSILDQPEVIAYRAPEQLEPSRTVDERADVFTIGVLLWEMISGRTLFGPAMLPRPGAAVAAKPGRDPIAVSAARRRVLSHPVTRLDALPALKGKVAKDVANAVARCLERDVSKRFQTLREVVSALSANADNVATHDAVAAFVTSLGIPQHQPVAEGHATAPVSSRPTAPPVDDSVAPKDGLHDGATRPGVVARPEGGARTSTAKSLDGETRDFGETATKHAARMLEVPDSIPPDTDIESLPPSMPPDADIESLPPSMPPDADIESLPPSVHPPAAASAPSTEVVPAPPFAPAGLAVPSRVDVATSSMGEAVTVPPLAALEASRLELAGAEGSITLMSGVEPAAAKEREARASAEERAAPPVGEEPTSAPVARPVDHSSALPGSALDADDAVFSQRRDRTRRVVVVVMIAAALLVVAAVLRAVLSRSADEAGVSPAPATSRAVATAAVPSFTASPESSTTAATSAAAPTSVPAAAPAAPPVNGVQRPGKKRPYRPSGI